MLLKNWINFKDCKVNDYFVRYYKFCSLQILNLLLYQYKESVYYVGVCVLSELWMHFPWYDCCFSTLRYPVVFLRTQVASISLCVIYVHFACIVVFPDWLPTDRSLVIGSLFEPLRSVDEYVCSVATLISHCCGRVLFLFVQGFSLWLIDDYSYGF